MPGALGLFVGTLGLNGSYLFTPVGGGAPEWLPEGADAAAFFSDGNYYMDGISNAVDMFQNQGGSAIDTNKITALGWQVSTDENYGEFYVEGKSELHALLADGFTMVLDATLGSGNNISFRWRDSGNNVSYGMDLHTPSLTSFYDFADFWYEPVGSGALSRQRIAITYIDGSISLSLNGSATHSGTAQVWSPAPDRFELNCWGDNSDTYITELVFYSPRLNGDLPGLSAL